MRPPLQLAVYGKTGLKREKDAFFGLANLSSTKSKHKPTQSNKLLMPEPMHSREFLQRLHSHPLSQSLLRGRREKNSRASLPGPFGRPWIPGVQLRAAVAVIHSCALSTHAVPMKTGFNFANPPTQHQPVPQVPLTAPQDVQCRRQREASQLSSLHWNRPWDYSPSWEIGKAQWFP